MKSGRRTKGPVQRTFWLPLERWEAFGEVASRKGTSRQALILAHIDTLIQEDGS